jgi:hypothetical protein
VVPKVRFELTRPCGHYALNVARLPFRHFGPSSQYAPARRKGEAHCPLTVSHRPQLPALNEATRSWCRDFGVCLVARKWVRLLLARLAYGLLANVVSAANRLRKEAASQT